MLHLLNNERMWLLEPDAYARLSRLPLLAAIPDTDNGGGAAPTIQGGLATVPIRGTLLRAATEGERYTLRAYGVDYTETAPLARTLTSLETNPDISVVLLDIDSPGGTVNGTPELANAVRSLSRRKHVYAFTAGLCCSAAYWVASQCDGIYAAPSSRVGSIGVLLPVTDSTEAYSRSGLKVELFSAGRYKGTGMRGTSLSDEQRALLQEQVNTTWAEFKEAVNARRAVAEEDMEGQTFTGRQGVARGLVDACSDSIEAVQEKLLRRHGC